jgi:hypothetical protein
LCFISLYTILFIYYSSLQGTTGSPKGATLSHHNILNNSYFFTLADNFAHNLCCQIQPDDNSSTCTFMTEKSVTCSGACANEILSHSNSLHYCQIGQVIIFLFLFFLSMIWTFSIWYFDLLSCILTWRPSFALWTNKRFIDWV